MEEQNKLVEESQVETRQGSGAILAAARKQQNRTVEEMAEELNLSVSQIKTIELDQTDGLPEPTYVRGYIRSYAKLLGLEPEQVLNSYLNPDWQKTSSLNDIPKGISAAEEAGGGLITGGRIVTLLVLAGVGASIWFFGLGGGLSGSSEPSITSAPSEVSSPQVESVQAAEQIDEIAAESQDEEELVEAAEQVEDPAQEQQSTTTEEASEQAESEQAAGEELVAEEVEAQARLVMSFSDTSWVDIRDINDQRLAYKSYAEGETLELSEQGELRVFIGNADGVSVQVDGEPFALSEYREGVYAKFIIQAQQ